MKNMSIGERVKLADFVDQSILNKKMFIEMKIGRHLLIRE